MPKDFQFSHLHSHTDHSHLDGHASVKELAEHVFQSGQVGFAVTDHGTMSNTYNGWAAAKAIREKYDKPFYFTPGIEAYVAPGDAHRSTREAIFFSNGSREDKAERSNDVSGGGAYTHLTMLGETTEGMHNLFRLNTIAWHEGIHRKPRMDIESISQYSKGIIATTGCPSGELQTRLRLGQWSEAIKYASKMQDIFGKENYFLEIMDHNMSIDLERRVRGDLMKVAKELNIPLLATNDLHYVRREDAKDHEHMLCIQSGSSMRDKPYDLGGKRFAFEGEEYYAKETHQMLKLFPHEEYPFAVQNAAEISMRSTAEFKYNPDLRPSVPLPDGHDEHSFLREMVYAGLHRKRPDKANDQEYIDRIEKELGVLKEKNFSGYMLVVSDFTRWAKAQGWRVGPGRGSGGGSCVAFFTDITEIDPIPHGLIFERFLNPERDSPPDIDSDFDEHREEVIEYVRQKYGEEMVSMIITIGNIKAKSAIKDIARIYEEPYAVGEVLTKALPKPVAGKEISLREVFDPEAARYDEAEGFREEVRKLENKNLVPYALGIEGKMRQWGVHAAGVIMSKTPIKDSIPLMMRAKDNVTITQFDYPTCEDLGLIKMDFLGLRNLTVINKCIKAIEQNHGIVLIPEEIYDSVLDNPDQKTLDIINSGRTIGIFQLDSTDITSLARLIHVTEFNDISAILALYRPGPMGMNSHINYADRKNGRAPITPIHPDLDEALNPILAETFQVICYQEQIQFIAQKVAGYSLGRADILRRAMGKKKKSILDAEFVPFSEGMRANGYKEDAINALWETLIPFAEYGFNKCLHGRTRVVLENGQTATIKELKDTFNSGQEVRILSMFEDGSIRPHLVKDVVKSGLKPLWTIRTKAGRSIQLTEEHRLLSVDGYGTIEDGGLHVGQELIAESEKKTFHISEDDRNRRKNHISSYSKTDIARENARQRMADYQGTLSYDDRSAHQQRVQIANPDRNKIGKAYAVEKLRDLWANDAEWQSNTLTSFRKAKRALYDTGRGFGKTTILSDGRITDSMVEALAAEYLLDRGVEFELHKQFVATNGKVRETDFYAQGIYFEMDGLDRGRQWFADNKYGEDIPFVYLTPQNYVDEIDAALMRHGIENGDEIVEIIPPKENKTGGVYHEMTYDIEMDSSGPANFIANGIVSHNSHSAGYALISYLTAYLKANYGAEFMAANLSTMTDDKEKTAIYLQECRQMGITVLPPDVSISTADYTATKDGTILVGLEAIRGVGHEVAEALNREVIENGTFKNLDDFLARAPSSTLSKTALEGFAHAGALDGFGYSRRSMHKFMPEVATGFAQAKKKQDAGQFSLFDMVEESESPKANIQNLPEYTKKDKLMFERHALGLYVSDHPLSGIANMLERFCDTQALDIISGAEKPSGGGFGDRKTLRLAGVANSVIKKPTRKGGMFATFDLEDISGTIPCLIFPKAYERLGDKIFSDSIYQISGSLLEGDSEDDIKFAVDTIDEIELTESGQIPFEIQLGLSQASEEALQDLQSVLLQSPGEMPVHLIVRRSDGRSQIYELGEEFKVSPTKELLQQIRMLFGVKSIV